MLNESWALRSLCRKDRRMRGFRDFTSDYAMLGHPMEKTNMTYAHAKKSRSHVAWLLKHGNFVNDDWKAVNRSAVIHTFYLFFLVLMSMLLYEHPPTFLLPLFWVFFLRKRQSLTGGKNSIHSVANEPENNKHIIFFFTNNCRTPHSEKCTERRILWTSSCEKYLQKLFF